MSDIDESAFTGEIPTRRDAASTLSGLDPEASHHGEPERWDIETDVVVVGFGGAGAAAAIEAADRGADVLILEKMRKPGGATFMSGGIIYAAGTATQRAAGIADTADGMYRYYVATDHGLKDPAVARVLADKSAEAIEWIETLGAIFPPEDLYMSGAENEFEDVTTPKARAHHVRMPATEALVDGPSVYSTLGNFVPGPGGPQLFSVLERAVRNRGIKVSLETAAEELITSPHREVIGVKVRSKGKARYIHARRAIVLADGGFTRNLDMHKKFSPKAAHIMAGRIIMRGHPGATGDGIRMAMALGADLCDMPAYHAHPSPYVPIGEVAVVSPGARYASIYVNAAGQRFVNEDRHYVIVSAALDKQDSVAFQIFDDAAMKQLTLPPWKAKLLTSAPTMTALAKKLGIAAKGLEATVETWNRHATTGQDPEFGKSGPTVGPIANHPFWGAPLRREFNITYGGLRTNIESQVLDALHGKPIQRLYAAGQTTGGRWGSFYPGSGSAITDCIVFGRIAGQNAAAEARIPVLATVVL